MKHSTWAIMAGTALFLAILSTWLIIRDEWVLSFTFWTTACVITILLAIVKGEDR